MNKCEFCGMEFDGDGDFCDDECKEWERQRIEYDETWGQAMWNEWLERQAMWNHE